MINASKIVQKAVNTNAPPDVFTETDEEFASGIVWLAKMSGQWTGQFDLNDYDTDGEKVLIRKVLIPFYFRCFSPVVQVL